MEVGKWLGALLAWSPLQDKNLDRCSHHWEESSSKPCLPAVAFNLVWFRCPLRLGSLLLISFGVDRRVGCQRLVETYSRLVSLVFSS